jgi:hypothetical protein
VAHRTTGARGVRNGHHGNEEPQVAWPTAQAARATPAVGSGCGPEGRGSRPLGHPTAVRVTRHRDAAEVAVRVAASSRAQPTPWTRPAVASGHVAGSGPSTLKTVAPTPPTRTRAPAPPSAATWTSSPPRKSPRWSCTRARRAITTRLSADATAVPDVARLERLGWRRGAPAGAAAGRDPAVDGGTPGAVPARRGDAVRGGVGGVEAPGPGAPPRCGPAGRPAAGPGGLWLPGRPEAPAARSRGLLCGWRPEVSTISVSSRAYGGRPRPRFYPRLGLFSMPGHPASRSEHQGGRSSTKEKAEHWTHRRAFAQVRHGSNIQLLPYSLVTCEPLPNPQLLVDDASGSPILTG